MRQETKIKTNINKVLTKRYNVDRHEVTSYEMTEQPSPDPHCWLARVRTVCVRT